LHLRILQLKFGLRVLAHQLSIICQPFGVIGELFAQSLDVGAGLLEIGFELFDLLLRLSKRRFELINLVLEGRWIDLEQDGPGFYRLVRLDRDLDDLAGDVRCHLDHP
jgi:hypothetical protein